jgi:hypothetical protein
MSGVFSGCLRSGAKAVMGQAEADRTELRQRNSKPCLRERIDDDGVAVGCTHVRCAIVGHLSALTRSLWIVTFQVFCPADCCASVTIRVIFQL